jgi:mitochondrial chaperone BCS1
MVIPFMTSLRSLPPWLLLGVGVVTGYLKGIWSWFYNHTIGWVEKKVSVSITVEEFVAPEAYNMLVLWVEKHLEKRRVSSLLLRVRKSDEDDDEDEGPQVYKPKSIAQQYEMTPHYGVYHMMWNHRPLIIDHVKESVQGGNTASVRRTLTLKLWGVRERAVLLDILKDAQDSFDRSHPRLLNFYTPFSWGGWRKSIVTLPRTKDTVYMPGTTIDEVMADAETFLLSKRKYDKLGVPYRRGYLLHGPPGTGKTTLVQAISAEFRLPIYSLVINDRLDHDSVRDLLAKLEPRSILLFEDVDCLSISRDRKDKADGQTGGLLTLSDLLNAIDGIGAAENRIVIMTTNFVEKLDPALIRSGRIDRRWEIGLPGEEELHRFYCLAAEEFPVAPWEEFRATLPEHATIADAQAMAFRGYI